MKDSLFKYALVVAVLPLIYSCHKTDKKPSEELTVDVSVPTVDSVVLHKEYPGFLSADKTVDLVARVNGYQVASPYTGGSFVKKGTVLFRIEDTQYRSAVNEAKAQLETARSNAIYAEQRFAAMKKALASDAVSVMEYNEAESQLNSAHAAVQQAQAALGSASTTLGYCVVTAPFDGHVSNSVYNDGAFLSGEGAPVKLATIYDDAKMKANFNIEDVRYIEMMKNNSKSLDIDFSKIPLVFSTPLPHEYTADMSYMSQVVDRSTGTLLVQADVDNPYGELRSGMYVKVLMPYAVDTAAVMIKDAAIGTDQLGSYIYVVNDSNEVVYTPIETGETVHDSLRIVTKGINRNDRYVTKALLKVRNGQKVMPRLTK